MEAKICTNYPLFLPCFRGDNFCKFLPPPNFYVFSYKKWTINAGPEFARLLEIVVFGSCQSWFLKIILRGKNLKYHEKPIHFRKNPEFFPGRPSFTLIWKNIAGGVEVKTFYLYTKKTQRFK